MEKGAKIAFALRGPFSAAKKNVCEYIEYIYYMLRNIYIISKLIIFFYYSNLGKEESNYRCKY